MALFSVGVNNAMGIAAFGKNVDCVGVDFKPVRNDIRAVRCVSLTAGLANQRNSPVVPTRKRSDTHSLALDKGVPGAGGKANSVGLARDSNTFCFFDQSSSRSRRVTLSASGTSGRRIVDSRTPRPRMRGNPKRGKLRASISNRAPRIPPRARIGPSAKTR